MGKSSGKDARQMVLFHPPDDSALWIKTFTIELLDGRKLRMNLETIRRLRKLELPHPGSASVPGAKP